MDTVLLQLIEGLDRTKYQPFVLLAGHSPYVEKYESLGVKVFIGKLAVFGKPTSYRYYWDNALKLVSTVKTVLHIIKTHRIDLVHSHKMELMGGNIAAKLKGIPAVQTVHELPRGMLPAYQMVGLLNHILNDTVVVLCERSKVMFRWFGKESGKLRKIYNGIQFSETDSGSGFNPIREQLSLSSEVPLMMTVARLAPEKGIETLIRAAAAFKREGHQGHFVIVGDATFEHEKVYKEQLFALTGELNVTDRVHFVGLRRDVPDLLKQADVFVLSSVYDTFPTAILEAMRAGLPVVSTDVGGVPEMVRPDNGLMTPVFDHEALAKAVASLLSMNYRTMGQNGQKLMESEFSRQAYVNETVRLYEELWAQYGKGGSQVEYART
ncbi:glycosyltransferase family 4 protein [Paenibacillus sp. KR2-11]|uniref:glycosyltransferase family 4 protein n=1 Tax=Paenibacillus sp. KR2-11 TaxID=3385500 RepID=UPI0038FCB25D|nr:glycosyltransferase family 4 protein [Paenibacillus caseinilyticus]